MRCELQLRSACDLCLWLDSTPWGPGAGALCHLTACVPWAGLGPGAPRRAPGGAWRRCARGCAKSVRCERCVYGYCGGGGGEQGGTRVRRRVKSSAQSQMGNGARMVVGGGGKANHTNKTTIPTRNCCRSALCAASLRSLFFHMVFLCVWRVECGCVGVWVLCPIIPIHSLHLYTRVATCCQGLCLWWAGHLYLYLSMVRVRGSFRKKAKLRMIPRDEGREGRKWRRRKAIQRSARTHATDHIPEHLNPSSCSIASHPLHVTRGHEHPPAAHRRPPERHTPRPGCQYSASASDACRPAAGACSMLSRIDSRRPACA